MRHCRWILALCLTLAMTPRISSAGSSPGLGPNTDDDTIDLWYAIGIPGGVSSSAELGVDGSIGQSGMSYADGSMMLLGGYWTVGADDTTSMYPVLAVGEDLNTQFALLPVTPNPTRGVAYVAWTAPRESFTRLTVHDVQGRQVALLVDGVQPAGRHTVQWDPSAARLSAAGMYFVRLRTPDGVFARRVVVTP